MGQSSSTYFQKLQKEKKEMKKSLQEKQVKVIFEDGIRKKIIVNEDKKEDFSKNISLLTYR